MASDGVPFPKVSSSTADFGILYERITVRASQRKSCTCKQTGSEYPEYAAEELALFHKLQSGLTQHPAKANKVPVPTEEKIGLKINGENISKNVAVPDEESHLMDCEILWVGSTKSSDPQPNQPAQKIDMNGNLETVAQNELEDHIPPSIPIDEPEPDSAPNIHLSSTKSNLLKNQKNLKIVPGELLAYQCKICSLSLSSYDDLKIHLSNHATRSKEQADIYRQSRTLLARLVYAEKTGKRRQQNCCRICNKLFMTRADLREHTQKCDAANRPYQCSLCPKNYICRYHLIRHEKQKHQIEK